MKKSMKRNVALIIGLTILFTACTTTVDVEKEKQNEIVSAQDDELVEGGDMTDEEYMTYEEMKESDVHSAVVFIEPPEVRYVDDDKKSSAKENSSKVLKSGDAVKQHVLDKTIIPEYEDGHLKAWYYKPENVYQLQTQTYHSTIIQLEPGEEMMETPYISEPDVWRLSRGIGTKNGKPTQFVIIKPDYVGLTSTLIIITNLRVYQLELRSYRDRYMPYAKWIYQNRMEDLPSWGNYASKKQEIPEFSGQKVEFLSFDYKIKRPMFKKPVWTPVLVYDDGAKTYIVLDKKSLHMEIPTVFKGKKEITNKEIRKNVIVLNELIEKVTLRHGKQKVTIVKKISKQRTNNNSADTESGED